jgi:coenzyme Q-binding protein COQ10
MAEAQRSIVINAPLEKVFSVITDYDRYGEFLQEVKRVTSKNRQGNEVEVHYEVDVIKTIKYAVKMKETKPSRVEWSFINGEMMKDNRGSWVLEDAGNGTTKATYNIEMKLGALVPGSVVKALVETQLPKMLESFKKRAEAA